MIPQTVHTVFFSPTRTSRKIARAVTQGLSASGQVAVTDVTHKAAAETTFAADAAVVFVFPVYGGKVAPAALERMESLRGEGTPAIVVVVYGNRDIGQAAAQLAAFVAERGFVPIAAGAFVGEHSYSTDKYPIAALRPDPHDLAEATAFGAKVRQKLADGSLKTVDAARLRAPRTPLLPLLRFIAFVIRYRRGQKKHPVVLLPATDTALCTHCGRCAAVCPTTAIRRGEEERTDPARCIRCCACVKICPVAARSFDTPFAAALSRNFPHRKPAVTLL